MRSLSLALSLPLLLMPVSSMTLQLPEIDDPVRTGAEASRDAAVIVG